MVASALQLSRNLVVLRAEPLTHGVDAQNFATLGGYAVEGLDVATAAYLLRVLGSTLPDAGSSSRGSP